ncbi:MAG: cobyric acid synthase, partial [Actinomycetota bacterium]
VESRSPAAVEGLGLLPVECAFEKEKVLANPTGTAPGFGGVPAAGYEIHHGRVRRFGAEPLFLTDTGEEEGCRAGAVLGTCWHGVLECDGFRRAVLAWVAEAAGRAWAPGSRPFAEVREARLDTLGDLVERYLDTHALASLIERGPTPGLPCHPPGDRW